MMQEPICYMYRFLCHWLCARYSLFLSCLSLTQFKFSLTIHCLLYLSLVCIIKMKNTKRRYIDICIIVHAFWPAQYEGKQEKMVSQIVSWNYWWHVPWLSDRLLVTVRVNQLLNSYGYLMKLRPDPHSRNLYKSTCTRNLYTWYTFLRKFFLVQVSYTKKNASLLCASL